MKLKLPAGQTSVMLPIFVRDTSSSTGAGLGSLTSGTSGLVGEYRRRGSSSWTAITLTSATLGTFTSGGWVADGSLSGAYEVGIPDAALASPGRWVAIRYYGAANMAPVLIELELDAIDYQDGTRAGLKALPAANAEAAGGLITRGTGTGQMSVLSGQVSVAGIANGAISSSTFTAGALGAVWDELKSAHTVSGSFGSYLDAASSTLATSSALTTVGTIVSTILGQTGTTGVVVAAGSKSGYSLATTPPTAAQIATQVWSETVPGSYTTNQAGNVLGNVATGTPPSAATIADAVWDELISGHDTAGTFGAAVTTDQASLSTLLTRLTNTRAGLLDNLANLDATISSTASASGQSAISSSLATVSANVSAIGVIVSSTGAVLTQAERNSIANTVLGFNLASVTGAASRSLLNAIRFLRNKWSISGSTLTVTAEDDATTAWTATIAREADAVNSVKTVDPA